MRRERERQGERAKRTNERTNERKKERKRERKREREKEMVSCANLSTVTNRKRRAIWVQGRGSMLVLGVDFGAGDDDRTHRGEKHKKRQK